MKIYALASVFLLMSCSEKPAPETTVTEENPTVAPYDTAALDSFSAGATAANTANRLRLQNRKSQDSLQSLLKSAEAEKKAAAEQAEKLLEQKKLDDERKKADALKIKAEKVKPSPAPPDPAPTP